MDDDDDDEEEEVVYPDDKRVCFEIVVRLLQCLSPVTFGDAVFSELWEVSCPLVDAITSFMDEQNLFAKFLDMWILPLSEEDDESLANLFLEKDDDDDEEDEETMRFFERLPERVGFQRFYSVKLIAGMIIANTERLDTVLMHEDEEGVSLAKIFVAALFHFRFCNLMHDEIAQGLECVFARKASRRGVLLRYVVVECRFAYYFVQHMNLAAVVTGNKGHLLQIANAIVNCSDNDQDPHAVLEEIAQLIAPQELQREWTQWFAETLPHINTITHTQKYPPPIQL
eukprot:TRINITY_DN20585_c0_g1_i1.p1 TRINITY_DN20585_c0_g1~~TRINITY_DN20585_c0_g1_i1.p1  ORF type:complete len:314 (-),score=60.75 TRINITY_DN20585_c0_g1_i1:139-990(-)